MWNDCVIVLLLKAIVDNPNFVILCWKIRGLPPQQGTLYRKELETMFQDCSPDSSVVPKIYIEESRYDVFCIDDANTESGAYNCLTFLLLKRTIVGWYYCCFVFVLLGPISSFPRTCEKRARLQTVSTWRWRCARSGTIRWPWHCSTSRKHLIVLRDSVWGRGQHTRILSKISVFDVVCVPIFQARVVRTSSHDSIIATQPFYKVLRTPPAESYCG